MRTSGRHTLATAGALHNIPNRADVSAGNRAEKADHGSFGSRYAFLRSRFRPIAPQFVSAGRDGVNCITERNYLYLRDSYYRYAELLCVAPKHVAGQSPGDGIAVLYHRMDKIVGDDINVNVEADGDDLHFTLWKQHDWGEYSLYWFPIKFAESLSPRLRRIAITFMHRLSHANGIPTMNGTELAEYTLDWIETNIADPACEEREELKATCDSYRNGKAYTALRRVENGDGVYADLDAAINEYVPRNDREQRFLELVRKGTEFIRDDSPAIMQYAYDADYEESPEFEPIRLDQSIMIVYDNFDTVSEYMIEILNGLVSDSYEIVPCTTMDVSPTTERLFAMDDYPERFFGWADEFLNFTLERQ